MGTGRPSTTEKGMREKKRREWEIWFPSNSRYRKRGALSRKSPKKILKLPSKKKKKMRTEKKKRQKDQKLLFPLANHEEFAEVNPMAFPARRVCY